MQFLRVPHQHMKSHGLSAFVGTGTSRNSNTCPTSILERLKSSSNELMMPLTSLPLVRAAWMKFTPSTPSASCCSCAVESSIRTCIITTFGSCLHIFQIEAGFWQVLHVNDIATLPIRGSKHPHARFSVCSLALFKPISGATKLVTSPQESHYLYEASITKRGMWHPRLGFGPCLRRYNQD